MTHHAKCQHVAYRLSCSDFDELWAHAGGCCEICGTAASDTVDGKLVIDHDGRYGYFTVRGLLCQKCNSLMRYIDRGEKRDRRASAYIAQAWFVRVLHQRHATNVADRRRARKATPAATDA